MKVFNKITIVFLTVLAVSSCKKETIKGDYFGAEFEISSSVDKTALAYANITPKDSVQTQIVGEITEVCQAKGCWMKVKLDSEEEVFVRFKDYGFFVPKDAAGKTVVMNGAAFFEEMSVDDQRHYAEDEGASEDELALITSPKKTYRFEADGVLIAQQP
ncbi:DUF4920 domain-containing protein [Flagellimonas zhangzhouensis]|uniref:DUF4920 domain-containing protein n=1 Tax=Flagellimonas zhangzhouensis TaxID=1073328 RepID=A0A1H2QUS9_9FLAO|nr:DUF4920 domain-containing protein [Allomuricauda zhangzhouensis]SDQ56370.1 protein of unknown function [Allomuricauda zhangzhouensis]SDW10189.1 protein of unknown function [Allomuricauda zhangzhouensis]